MANKVFVAASLDGFIAEKNGSVEWLNQIPNPSQSDYGYSNFMAGIDALVMGRNTFEVVLGFGEWHYSVPVFVLSNSLKDIPDHLKNKVELIKGDVRNVVKGLNSRGYKNLYVDGGKTVQEFLKQDMIDEMIITWVSVLLGKGIPLFGNIGEKRSFKLKKTEMLNENLVQQYYLRA